jgi:hypothetical protein
VNNDNSNPSFGTYLEAKKEWFASKSRSTNKCDWCIYHIPAIKSLFGLAFFASRVYTLLVPSAIGSTLPIYFSCKGQSFFICHVLHMLWHIVYSECWFPHLAHRLVGNGLETCSCSPLLGGFIIKRLSRWCFKFEVLLTTIYTTN